MARGNVREWFAISTGVVVLSLVVYPVIIPYLGYMGLSSWWLAMQLFSHGTALFWLLRDRMADQERC